MSNKMTILYSELTCARESSIAAFEEAVKNISIYLLEEAERGNWGDEQTKLKSLYEKSGADELDEDTENMNLGLYVPAGIDMKTWRVGDPLGVFKNAYAARLIVNVIFHHNKIAEIIYTLIAELLLLLQKNVNDDGKTQLQEYGRLKPASVNETVKSLESVIKEKNIEVDLKRFREIVLRLENDSRNYDRESRLSDWLLDNIQERYPAGSDTTSKEYLCTIDDTTRLSTQTILSTLPSARRERPIKNIVGDSPSAPPDRPWENEQEQTGYSIFSFQSIWMSEFGDYPINLVNTIIDRLLSRYIVPLRDIFHVCFHLKAHLICARNIDASWYEKATFVYGLPPVYSIQDTWLELENLLNVYACVAKIFLNMYDLLSLSSHGFHQSNLIRTKETYINTIELLECMPTYLFDGKWMDDNFYSWPYTRRSVRQLPVRDYLSENYLLKTALVVPPKHVSPITKRTNKNGTLVRLKIKAVEYITFLRTGMQEIFDDGFVTIVKDTLPKTTNVTSHSDNRNNSSMNDVEARILYDSTFENNPYVVHPLYHIKIAHHHQSSNKGLASIEEWDVRYHLASENGVLLSSITNNNNNNRSSWFWRSLPLFKPSLLKDSSNSLPYKFWETALSQIHHHQDLNRQMNYSKNTEMLESIITTVEITERSIEIKKKSDIEDIIIQDKQLESYEKHEERRIRNVERSIFLTILCKNLLTTLMNIGGV